MENELRILLVPGGGGSGVEHWDHQWEANDKRIERVIQSNWDGGSREDWVIALDHAIQSSTKPVILVAHSLGNIAVSHWADNNTSPVVGALLIAPADINADWVSAGSLYSKFLPIPMNRLPFPSILVASSNDPYLSMPRASVLAKAWGSSLRSVGNLDHIGSESKLEDWQEGRRFLDEVIKLANIPNYPKATASHRR